MLISRLKKALLKPARPARRRIQARTIQLQDLEPRLFLSVNSLLATDTATAAAETTADAGIESATIASASIDDSSINNAQLDAAVGSDAVTEAAVTPGSTSGSTAWADNPNFVNVYSTSDPRGTHIAGSVDWEDYPFSLYGMTIKMIDNATGQIAGFA